MRHRLRRPIARLLSLCAALALLLSIVTTGKRFFFCAAMDRLHADVSCCDHFEPALEDVMRAETEGAAIREDERCCDGRVQNALPGGLALAAPEPLAAPWTGEVVLPPLVALELPPAPHLTRERWLTTGPPTPSAPEICARLSVFVI
jgi:hypothetical protein